MDINLNYQSHIHSHHQFLDVLLLTFIKILYSFVLVLLIKYYLHIAYYIIFLHIFPTIKHNINVNIIIIPYFLYFLFITSITPINVHIVTLFPGLVIKSITLSIHNRISHIHLYELQNIVIYILNYINKLYPPLFHNVDNQFQISAYLCEIFNFQLNNTYFNV